MPFPCPAVDVNEYLLNEFMNFCPSQDPWELALLTETWHTKLTSIKLPFLEEIAFGSLIRLKKCQTSEDGVLPSAECKFYTNYFNCQFCVLFWLLEKCFNQLIRTRAPYLGRPVFAFGIQECAFFWVMDIQF